MLQRFITYVAVTWAYDLSTYTAQLMTPVQSVEFTEWMPFGKKWGHHATIAVQPSGVMILQSTIIKDVPELWFEKNTKGLFG